MKFSTPYCGYAPGQKIHFVLYINNESSIDITACEVKLKQEVTYESHDPQHEYRYDKNLIARKQFGNVLRWSRKVYRGYLDLHSIPPTSAKTPCPILVNYLIKIIVNPTEFHWKMKLKIPLTIGSTPIMDSQLAINEALLSTTMRHHHLNHNQQSVNNQHPQNSANNNHSNNSNRISHNNSPSDQRSQQQQRQQEQHEASSIPALLVTNEGDNPPDYIPMGKIKKQFLIS